MKNLNLEKVLLEIYIFRSAAVCDWKGVDFNGKWKSQPQHYSAYHAMHSYNSLLCQRKENGPVTQFLLFFDRKIWGLPASPEPPAAPRNEFHSFRVNALLAAGLRFFPSISVLLLLFSNGNVYKHISSLWLEFKSCLQGELCRNPNLDHNYSHMSC